MLQARRTSRPLALVFLFVVNVFWGLSFIASKYALGFFPPMTLAFLRYLMACVLLVPLSLAAEGRPRFARRDLPSLALSAVFGVTIYYFFEYTGMQFTTASTASLILAAVPALSLVYGALFRRKPLTLVRVVSVLLSLLGVLMVISSAGTVGGTLKGNLMILMCCVTWVAYVEVNSGLRTRYSSLSLTTWQAVVALVTLLPFALNERARWLSVTPLAWVCVAALAIICSALCYFLYAEALSGVDAFTATLFININPIAAVLGGMLLLGERVSPLQLAGGALILLSLFADSFSGKLKPKQTKP